MQGHPDLLTSLCCRILDLWNQSQSLLLRLRTQTYHRSIVAEHVSALGHRYQQLVLITWSWWMMHQLLVHSSWVSLLEFVIPFAGSYWYSNETAKICHGIQVQFGLFRKIFSSWNFRGEWRRRCSNRCVRLCRELSAWNISSFLRNKYTTIYVFSYASLTHPNIVPFISSTNCDSFWSW